MELPQFCAKPPMHCPQFANKMDCMIKPQNVLFCLIDNTSQEMCTRFALCCALLHDDVIKWKHFPRYWPFVWGIQRSPVNSSHKGQWRRALIFSLICAWMNGWANNGAVGDLRRHRAHYDVTVMVVENRPILPQILQDYFTDTRCPFC